jgi:hypothetical protein
MSAFRGSAPNIFISRADSHEVGGEGNEPVGSEAAGGEGSASHEKGGGESLIRFSLSVIVVVVER